MPTNPYQSVLLRPAEMEGRGLHTGQWARVRLVPVAPGRGILLHRLDIPGQGPYPLECIQVSTGRLATGLLLGEAPLLTVEHLLAALVGLGVDNALVEVEGPEIPAGDGSALPFVDLIDRAGRGSTRVPRGARRGEEVEAHRGEAWASLAPASEGLVITGEVRFPHPLIGRQRLAFPLKEALFRSALAPARTFGFLDDVVALWGQNRARGGGLDNALVFSREGVINPGGLRFPDEVVRHKILDALGDLALLGGPLQARVRLSCAGHPLHHELVKRARLKGWGG